MALPSESEIQVLLDKATKYLDDQLIAAPAAVVNLEAFIDDAGAYSTRQVTAAVQSAEANRSRLATTLEVSSASAILTPLWEIYFEVLGLPARSVSEGFALLREDFNDNSKSVNARGVTYGTPAAAGANVGDGVVNRCTEDQYGEPLEAVFSETKIIRCTSDQHSRGGGTLQEERFTIRGAIAAQDQITRTGSGVAVDVIAESSRRSLLGNSGFDTVQAIAGDLTNLSDVTNWTVDTIANLEASSVDTYRASGGVSTALAFALNMVGNVKLTQKFSVRNIQWDATRPAYLHVAFNRDVGSGDGTLTLRIGSKSVSVVLSAQTGWNLLILPLDLDSWHLNWNEDDPGIEIELTGNTTGDTLIDDVVFVPMVRVDGTYWNVVGAEIPFLLDDEFSATDSETDASAIQKWLYRTYGVSLPSDNAGGETWVGS